jgi:hypothetical protein
VAGENEMNRVNEKFKMVVRMKYGNFVGMEKMLHESVYLGCGSRRGFLAAIEISPYETEDAIHHHDSRGLFLMQRQIGHKSDVKSQTLSFAIDTSMHDIQCFRKKS